MRARVALVLALVLPQVGGALELSLPSNAVMSAEIVEEADTFLLPTGPFADATLPRARLEGRVTQQAWRVTGQGLTTLQVLRPMREELEVAGWQVLFECSNQDCGGFDFRFNAPILAAPDMFVDLFDFRYLAARRGDDGAGLEYVALLVSRSGDTGYVQISHISATGAGAVQTLPDLPVAQGEGDEGQATTPLAQALLAEGHVVLGDLDFASGATALGPGPFASLATLAAFLNADPARRIALVGHTDSVGALDANIALSRARARAVLERLVTTHGVTRAQLEAEGLGYLAPIASNRDPATRDLNRRVEAVLLDTR
ncbi:Outer membrane porin F precursor [Roseovarius gaetbuli]|uniref:Outer membrane porin F n=1 Tax=Roseovarius gaetbuli TaxID=1356575 RepID=A0A1X6ZDI3_9RHOB|nr:OmpA family protein [Roseovarius gaetbuli]SLN48510.1 Outer membrane porin F precursor [Roseovarius gaetbuli]